MLTWLGLGAVLAAFCVIRHTFFLSGAFDLGFYVQNTWLLSHGKAYCTIAGYPVFADHLSPILYPLALMSLLPGSTELWLVIQGFAVAAGVLPAYRLGRALAGSTGGLLATLWYALSATLWFAVFYDVHPMVFGIPILVWMMATLEERPEAPSTRALLIGELALVAMREDVAVLGAIILLYAFVRSRRRVFLVTSCTVIVLELAYLALGPTLVGSKHGYVFADRYASYGKGALGLVTGLPTHLSQVFERLTSGDAIVVYIVLLGPMLFLSLFGLRRSWPGFALIAFNLLSDQVYTHTIVFQYQAPAVPFFIWGALAGYQRLADRGMVDPRTLARVCIGATVAIFVLYGPIIGLSNHEKDRSIDYVLGSSDRRALRDVVEQVPDDVELSASYELVPHLAQRERIHIFPLPFVCAKTFPLSNTETLLPEYVVIERGRDDEGPDSTYRKLPALGYRQVWGNDRGELWHREVPAQTPQPCPHP